MFNNLRSLAINCAVDKVDIKILLPKMKSLRTLDLSYDENEYLDYIYTECKSLHRLKYGCLNKDDILV